MRCWTPAAGYLAHSHPDRNGNMALYQLVLQNLEMPQSTVISGLLDLSSTGVRCIAQQHCLCPFTSLLENVNILVPSAVAGSAGTQKHGSDIQNHACVA